jgi:hypothetical protein
MLPSTEIGVSTCRTFIDQHLGICIVGGLLFVFGVVGVEYMTTNPANRTIMFYTELFALLSVGSGGVLIGILEAIPEN